MPASPADVDQRHRDVSPVELFFDLVFVFAVSQLADHLYEHVTWRGAADRHPACRCVRRMDVCQLRGDAAGRGPQGDVMGCDHRHGIGSVPQRGDLPRLRHPAVGFCDPTADDSSRSGYAAFHLAPPVFSNSDPPSSGTTSPMFDAVMVRREAVLHTP